LTFGLALRLTLPGWTSTKTYNSRDAARRGSDEGPDLLALLLEMFTQNLPDRRHQRMRSTGLVLSEGRRMEKLLLALLTGLVAGVTNAAYAASRERLPWPRRFSWKLHSRYRLPPFHHGWLSVVSKNPSGYENRRRHLQCKRIPMRLAGLRGFSFGQRMKTRLARPWPERLRRGDNTTRLYNQFR